MRTSSPMGDATDKIDWRLNLDKKVITLPIVARQSPLFSVADQQRASLSYQDRNINDEVLELVNTSKRLSKENERLRGWQRTAGVRSFLTLFDVASVFSFSQAAQKRDVDTLVSVAKGKVVSPGSRNPRRRTHSDTHTWSTHIKHGDGLIDGVAGKPRFHRHRSRLRCPAFACRPTDTETPIRSQNVRPWSKIHLLHRPISSRARQASRAMSCNESTAVCALHLPCPPTTELGLKHLFVQHHFYDKEIPSREIGSIERMLDGFRFNEIANSEIAVSNLLFSSSKVGIV